MKASLKTVPAIPIFAVAILVTPTFAEKDSVQSLNAPAVKQPAETVPCSEMVRERPFLSIPIPYNNEYGVEWHPHNEAVLTLSVSAPDGTVSRATCPSNTLPHYDFHNGSGTLRPDGTYVYQLNVIPGISPRTYEKMRSVQGSLLRDVIVGDMEINGELPAECLVQTGVFTFHNHQVVMDDEMNGNPSHTGDSEQPKVHKDRVFCEDLIVQMSHCVGIDYLNNESIVFDDKGLGERKIIKKAKGVR